MGSIPEPQITIRVSAQGCFCEKIAPTPIEYYARLAVQSLRGGTMAAQDLVRRGSGMLIRVLERIRSDLACLRCNTDR